MNPPSDEQWLRVEELGQRLSSLGPDDVAAQISQLAADGESPTVLTLLGGWLELPAPRTGFEVGSVIGHRYTLCEKLGEGGMGSVWRAKQEMVGREVALKMIHPVLVTPALQVRFLAEIEALGKLDHPGIVRIFDAGLEPQPSGKPVPFFAMELVNGLLLDRWAANHRQERLALLRVASGICAAVQSAHERRIVHRDLKPRNILIRPDGKPVVVDFGISRLAGIVAGEESGVFSGTPLYAAPEQHLGRDGNFRSGESVDIYAVGVILFELLSGRKLFTFSPGASVSEVRRTLLDAPLPLLSDVLPDCPPALVEIVAKALRRDPADRFYSMAALGRAISRVAEAEGPEPAPPPWTPAVQAVIPGTQWRLLEQLGQGGTGQVWLGRHDQLAERRVFKFCDTEEKARTLKRELSLFRLLKEHVGRNPHFIQLHEVSLDEPPCYLMMDETDAQDLPSWSQAQPGGLAGIPEFVRVEIVAQAAEALQAAHEAGILHRDIKPANLLIKGVGATGPVHVLIADFGIGQLTSEKWLREGTRLGFTRTVSDLREASLSGTMLYLAPEVLEGNAATARSDIYSLGVLLWQLLIGNLKAAVDPADWSSRISDPLLREDLGRCLAGAPEKRWSSANELAVSLRSLPERRAAAQSRRLELAARERAAYRRGVLRTVAAATGMVVVLATLAMAAWLQSQKAKRSRGEVAVKQANSLRQFDFNAGRRMRGMSLLEAAAQSDVDPPALRTACAAVLGLSDLVPAPPSIPISPAPTLNDPAPKPDEVCRLRSHNGLWLAVGRDVDGLNGAVDLVPAATGARSNCIQRQQFPWVPVPEPRLLAFSPDDKVLAIGGTVTSRHVLLCNVPDGTLNSYLYHGSDPLCCSWHSGGRLLGVGCADGSICIWDTTAAVNPASRRQAGDRFDLPPKLDVPAQDVPVQILRGHRGPVLHVVFSLDGQWLASLDAAGYLRIYTGFCRDGLPRLPDPRHDPDVTPASGIPAPSFAVEVQLPNVEQVTGLETREDHVIVRRGSLPPDEFQFVPGNFPAELAIVPVIDQIVLDAPGAKLCATTPTDILWLSTLPLEIVQTEKGQNPLGVSWLPREEAWLVAKDHELTEWHRANQGLPTLTPGARFRLTEAVPGQATRTAVTVAGDARVAAYFGKRVQFFRDFHSAASNSSVIANGGDGIFREIFWDTPGRLLGVVFELPDGDLRLEAWATSTGFPPECHALPPAVLQCRRIAPANDGQHCITRGAQRGLCLFDPATGKLSTLDSSSTARQDAPLACAGDGSFLAFVADGEIVRLLTLPGGAVYADLSTPRQADLITLAWDASGGHLASGTRDGRVQTWDLQPWKNWLKKNGLE